MADDRFKGAFYQGAQKPSFMTRLSRGLMGFAEGGAGRGQEYLASLRAQDEKEREDLLKASVTDAREINRLLSQVQPTAPAPSDSFDDYYRVDDKFSTQPSQPSPTNVNQPGIRESVDILNDRIGLLRERGQDDSDTMRIRDRILSGDIEAAQAELGSFLGDAQAHRPDWFPQADYATDNEVITFSDGSQWLIDKNSGTMTPVGPAKAPELQDEWIPITRANAAQYGLAHLTEEQFEQAPQYNNKTGELIFRGRQGSGTNVTVQNMGAIPQGYRLVYDENGNAVSMELIPGSPQAREIEAANNEANQTRVARRGGEISGLGYKSAAHNNLDVMREMVVNQTIWNPVTGPSTINPMTYLPGSEFKQFDAMKDTVVSNIGFERLQEMRDASPTGGALGQVSDNELRLLNSALGSLNQDLDDELMLNQIDQIRDSFDRVLEALADMARNDIEVYQNGDLKAALERAGHGYLFESASGSAGSDPLGIRQDVVDSSRLTERN